MKALTDLNQAQRLQQIAFVLGLVLCPQLASAATLWKGDFETGDLTQWDSTNLIKTGDRDNLVFVSDLVADGTKAAQITLRDDIIFEPYNQSRVEVKHNGLHTKNGEDSYYAWSFMVPADAEIRSNIGYWESRNTSKNTMTFFIEPGAAGGTDIAFGTGNLGQTVRWTQKLELNKWHRIAIQNHWSQTQADGKVSVWYDGEPVVTDATATKYDENELFFQMGLHRSDPSPPVQVIYIDAAIETDSQADILIPLPDPMGMGGAGGMGGMGGAAGSGGVTNAGSAGQASGGLGGASGGAGGVVGISGMPAVGGVAAGAGQAGSSSAPSTTSGVSSSDSGGCSVVPRPARATDYALLLLAALLTRRRRLRP